LWNIIIMYTHTSIYNYPYTCSSGYFCITIFVSTQANAINIYVTRIMVAQSNM